MKYVIIGASAAGLEASVTVSPTLASPTVFIEAVI